MEDLGGSVSVSSTAGRGSEISLRIPLSLAIIEGRLSVTGKNYYLINLSYIEECLDHSSFKYEPGREYINLRGTAISYIDLNSFFRLPPQEGNRQKQLIVVNADGKKTGVLVDEIHETYQTVIKSLGRLEEIFEYFEPVLIPRSSEYLPGIVNVRGKLYPVIDLRIRVGLEAADYTEDTCVIIMHL